MARKKSGDKDGMLSGSSLSFWDKLDKGTGLEVLDKMETVPCWIDTGILALNYVCSGKFVGGGIPSGKIIEIFGDSATGKSLIGTNILRGTQTIGGVPVLLDAEQAVSKDFAVAASKIDPKRFYVMSSDTLEGCFAKIYNAIRRIREHVPNEHPIVIIYDSIAASPSEREFAETQIDMENATQAAIKSAGAGVDKPGERAKTCSKHFRNLPKFLRENNAALVVINQIRQKIGVMFGSDETTAGGGRALEYYATIRLKLRANKVPKDDKGNVLGVNINVTNVKNRCFRPFVEARGMHLLFEQGINPFGGLLELFIRSDRVKGTSPGNYIVLDPYSDGKEVKFKANKDRNDVPSEVLLQCPSLIDAESSEQVQYYIDLYQSAIDAIDTKIVSEDECDSLD